MVRPNSEHCLHPTVNGRWLIISDHSLIVAIGCPQLLEDPSTCYLLAIIDVDGTVREVRIVWLYGITV